VTPADRRHRFEGLVPGELEVVLETRLGMFAQTVALHQGEHRHLVFEPELIRLRGRVLRGEKGHRGILTFATSGGDTKSVLADQAGAYEVILLRPALSVSIVLHGVLLEPFVEAFHPAISESGQRDFRLPNIRFRVRVVDEVSGKGVGQASVMATNTYFEEVAGPGSGREERSIGLVATTGDDGWAALSLFGPGRVEVWASAEGYLPLDTPSQARIAAVQAHDDHELEVRLTRDAFGLRPLVDVEPAE
jgi:hypothetical protein